MFKFGWRGVLKLKKNMLNLISPIFWIWGKFWVFFAFFGPKKMFFNFLTSFSENLYIVLGGSVFYEKLIQRPILTQNLQLHFFRHPLVSQIPKVLNYQIPNTPIHKIQNSQDPRFSRSQIPKFQKSQIPRIPNSEDSQGPEFPNCPTSKFPNPKFPRSQIPKIPNSQDPKFLNFHDPKFIRFQIPEIQNSQDPKFQLQLK